MYNKIFRNQQMSTLEEITEILNNSNELVLTININNIVPFYKHRSSFKEDKEQEEKYWEHIISILLMSQIKEKYEISTPHNVEEERKIITREDLASYEEKEKLFLNRNDVIETIKELGIPRIHIMLIHLNNESIWNELIHYLDKELGITTMIYSDGDIPSFQEENPKLIIPHPCYIIDRDFDNIVLSKEKVYEKKI